MSTPIPHQILTILSQLSWPFFSALTVLAAILFVRADPRHPAFCFLAGSILQLLIAVAALFVLGSLARFVGFDQGDSEMFQKYFAIQNRIGFVSQALSVYGLVMIGLIQFRKSKLPRIEDDPAG